MALFRHFHNVENAQWLVLLGGGEDVDIIQEQRELKSELCLNRSRSGEGAVPCDRRPSQRMTAGDPRLSVAPEKMRKLSF